MPREQSSDDCLRNKKYLFITIGLLLCLLLCLMFIHYLPLLKFIERKYVLFHCLKNYIIHFNCYFHCRICIRSFIFQSNEVQGYKTRNFWYFVLYMKTFDDNGCIRCFRSCQHFCLEYKSIHKDAKDNISSYFKFSLNAKILILK